MEAETIELLDSTLRDGAQAEGITFSVEDKIKILLALDQLGIPCVEAGNPTSNPKDLEFFQRASQLPLQHTKLVAFGSTCRKGTSPEEDRNLSAILQADTDAVAIFGKCWDLHVTDILCTSLEENLRMIEEACRFLTQKGKRVFFDAEHFFDGYAANAGYAVKALEAAARGGASCLVLCDTNGGTFPDVIGRVTREVGTRFPHTAVGIHTHNDRGMAVANSIMAVEA